jgi:hypothetical protein
MDNALDAVVSYSAENISTDPDANEYSQRYEKNRIGQEIRL